MRLLKLAVISVIVIFVIVTAITSLLPSNVLVSRAIDVRTHTGNIREQVFHLDKWPGWFTDAGGTPAKASFDSANNTLDMAGTKITAEHATDSSYVTAWKGKADMQSTFHIIDHHLPDSVITIQWQVEQKIKWYPWEKLASITKDEIWGGAMEKSLGNLKALLEAR
ncbi:MAG: hypothetical protein K0Q66_119 [Chitinophagaceae bacterium]|jgi:hypothetical protein|nr:hypothetical protein [Chitinophagaceae bacterium]